MKVLGMMIKLEDMGLWNIKIMTFMKEIGNMELKKEKENMFLKMGQLMKVNGTKMKNMVKE